VPVNQRCSFYYGDNLHAQYLGCDGAWNEIPTQNVVDGLDVTPGWSESRLNIMVCLLIVNRRRKLRHFDVKKIFLLYCGNSTQEVD